MSKTEICEDCANLIPPEGICVLRGRFRNIAEMSCKDFTPSVYKENPILDERKD